MENPGLITFGTSTHLGKPGERDIRLRAQLSRHRRARAGPHLVRRPRDHGVVGRHLAQRGFATWMAAKIVDRLAPRVGRPGARRSSRALGAHEQRRAGVARAGSASRSSRSTTSTTRSTASPTRRAPPSSRCSRPSSGRIRFRAAVRSYLARHAHDNATAADFLADVGGLVGRPEGEFGRAFSTFLEQPGYPLLTAQLSCEAGKTARVSLRQQRYRPQGSPGATQPAAQIWHIPVCVRHPDGRSCTLLKQETGDIELTDAKGCPAWIVGNAEAMGYYRVHHQGDLLPRLLRDGGKALSLPERVAVIGDVSALVRGGQMAYGDALASVPTLAKDQSRQIVTSVISLVSGLSDNHVAPELRARYQRFVARTFGARARRMGWSANLDDSDDARLLRPALLSVMVEAGEDKALMTQARGLAEEWIVDTKPRRPSWWGDPERRRAGRRSGVVGEVLRRGEGRTGPHRSRPPPGRHGRLVDAKIVAENFRVSLSNDLRPARIHDPGLRRDHRSKDPSARLRLREAELRSDHRAPPARLRRPPVHGRRRLLRRRTPQRFGRVLHRPHRHVTGGPRSLAQTLESMALCIALQRRPAGQRSGVFEEAVAYSPGLLRCSSEGPAALRREGGGGQSFGGDGRLRSPQTARLRPRTRLGIRPQTAGAGSYAPPKDRPPPSPPYAPLPSGVRLAPVQLPRPGYASLPDTCRRPTPRWPITASLPRDRSPADRSPCDGDG